jgi:hypothetical protein
VPVLKLTWESRKADWAHLLVRLGQLTSCAGGEAREAPTPYTVKHQRITKPQGKPATISGLALLSFKMANGYALPALESTLSMTEAAELLYLPYSNFGHDDERLLTGFVKFVSAVRSNLSLDTDNPYVQLMDSAESALGVIISIHNGTPFADMALRAFSGIVALSLMVDSAPTLNLFRLRFREIVNNPKCPFIANTVDSALIGVFMSSCFAFWLAYDQLDTNLESRQPTRSALRHATSTTLVTDTPFACWFKVVTENKFNANVSTILLPTKLNIIRRITAPDGRSIVAAIQTMSFE